MRAVIVCTRIIALLSFILITFSACRSNEPIATRVTVSGPALLFFYTDN
jgi:hypothetical protein